ncbi:MAG: non-canonical purine NTP pyrophosphatase, partial [Acetobacteraceae bacterium]
MARRLDPGASLVLASHNQGKLAEIAALVQPFGIAVIPAPALGLAEPEEDAPDFAGNARLKALAATRSGLPALADDSGFCAAALGGAPGIYSARWAGQPRDFARAMARVEREIGGNPDRRAWFISALALAWP